MKHPQYAIVTRAVEAYAVTRATLILRPSRRNSERVDAARAEVERALERLVEQATEDKSAQGIKEMQTAEARTEAVEGPRPTTTKTVEEAQTETGDETRPHAFSRTARTS
jgi:hypothetical protein